MQKPMHALALTSCTQSGCVAKIRFSECGKRAPHEERNWLFFVVPRRFHQQPNAFRDPHRYECDTCHHNDRHSQSTFQDLAQHRLTANHTRFNANDRQPPRLSSTARRVKFTIRCLNYDNSSTLLPVLQLLLAQNKSSTGLFPRKIKEVRRGRCYIFATARNGEQEVFAGGIELELSVNANTHYVHHYNFCFTLDDLMLQERSRYSDAPRYHVVAGCLRVSIILVPCTI